MTTTRISRDEEGLRIAEASAARADCARRQVGAYLMAPDGSPVMLGRNGLASGRPGCLTEGACPRGRLSYEDQPADVGYEETRCRAIHAEVNAIIRAGRERCVGATLYVTDEPCFHCSVVIEGAGIVRVVWPTGESLPQEATPEERAAADELVRETEALGLYATDDDREARLEVHRSAARRRAQLAETHPGWRLR